MSCLWCGVEQLNHLSWKNVLLPAKKNNLCATCAVKLAPLQGPSCQSCNQVTEEEVCLDCLVWEKTLERDPLTFNRSVFQYNSFIQEVIVKWKYRGDYILGEVFRASFLHSFKKEFAQLKNKVILVPIPLSDERLQERGFNQADSLMQFLPGEKRQIFTRMHSEKQAKKNRRERMKSDNPFVLQEKVNKPIILVDDIYTTGATLRHAASLLIKNGCPQVYSFTLIRG